MIAKFLKYDDARLEEPSDIEIQKIDDASGEVLNIDTYLDTTLRAVFNHFEKKHRKGIEVSVLDYGDELRATVTVNAKSIKHHYTVIMAS